MTERKIRLGIIGVGQIGKQHVNTYCIVPGVDIVAVCDLNQAEAERVAEENDISCSSVLDREVTADEVRQYSKSTAIKI